MTEQVEAYIDAGGECLVWMYDRCGFPIAVYSGETLDAAIERLEVENDN